MITLKLSDIASVVDGQLIGLDEQIDAVSTDTRNIEAGALFIALVGERFDGHDMVPAAVLAGAKAVMVSRQLDLLTVPQIVVENTKLALGQLGAHVHQRCQTPTLAITGSCGKTTVKEMVASILSAKGQVLYTAGNFNNDIGVPLTLLRSTEQDAFAVLELGANHIGEIAYTTALVQPDVALVNNVAAAHLEGFGSLDGVKQAKGEIYQGLKPGSVAIVNQQSNGGQYWRDVLADKRVRTFSVVDVHADYFASDIILNADGEAFFVLHTPIGEVSIQLKMAGKHNVANALAATALALEMGATLEMVKAGLSRVANVKGRVDVQRLAEHVTVIDDSYNASVPAMKAAIDLLANYQGERWLVLGNMAELGEESLALHRQVGEHAAPFSFEHVLTYGDDARAICEVCQGTHFNNHQSMVEFILQQLKQSQQTQHTLLVKGANSAGMSKIVAALKEYYQ